MNNQDMHNPWGGGEAVSDRPGRPRTTSNARHCTFDASAAGEAGRQAFRFLSAGAGKCRTAMPRLRVFATRWADRMRAHWRGGSRAGKPLAILYAAGGIVMLVFFGYLAVLLLPLLILGAFIAAILTALGARR